MELIPRARRYSRFQAAVAVICTLLVILAGALQVTHAHLGRAAHTDCSLCVAAHVTLHLAESPAPMPAAALTGSVELAALRSGGRLLSVFALYTRPPPTSASVA